jgi:hypothetical protein
MVSGSFGPNKDSSARIISGSLIQSAYNTVI